MKCPACQADYREGANYCVKCGTELEIKCSNCGHRWEVTEDISNIDYKAW